MKICKIRPDCWNCIVSDDYGQDVHDICEHCINDRREYEILGICTVGLFRKTMAILVNRNSKDLMQIRADLIYDIKNVEDNYFDKNRTEN